MLSLCAILQEPPHVPVGQRFSVGHEPFESLMTLSRGQHIRYPSCQIFTLQVITEANLQL